MSFTAPAVEGQAEVIALAQEMAGFSPIPSATSRPRHRDSARRPVEVEALAVPCRHRPQTLLRPSASVKSNFGCR